MRLPDEYLITVLVSNAVFGLALLAAVTRPLIARVFFVLLFIGAGVFNSINVFNDPVSYLMFADLTPIQIYKTFIAGYFADHVHVFVVIIAIGQVILGIAMAAPDPWTRLGFLGGMIFGLAITPLGVGSGFPSTLTMTVALFLLYREQSHDYLWKANQYRKPNQYSVQH
jgi:hypothetical protein